MNFAALFNVLSILGGIAFLYLFCIQVRDYRRHLRLLVTYLDCQPTGKGTSLIVVRLSFANPSSQGQAVYGVDVESKMSGTRLIELNQEVEPGLQNVTYSLSSVSRRLPFAETLQLPLDILPNQSLSRWLAIGVSYPDPDFPLGIYIHIVATQPMSDGKWDGSGYRGAKKKGIAKTGVIVFPAKRVSKTIDIYREVQTLPFARHDNNHELP